MSDPALPAASTDPALSTSDNGRPARRPRRTAILTVLGWNLVPLAVLVTTFAALASGRDESGEDWTGVIMIILLVFGGGLVAFGAGAGAVIATVMMSRALTPGRPAMTTSAAVLRGSGAALLGWLFAAAGLGLLLVANSLLSL